MDQLHTANKVCGGCCAISLNTVDTESGVSPTDKKVYISGYMVIIHCHSNHLIPGSVQQCYQ